MKTKSKSYTIVLSSIILFLFLIFFSSFEGIVNAQSTSPVAQYAYVTNFGSIYVPGNTVSVVDTATNLVIATVTVGNGPGGVAVTPDGTKVYVANYNSRTVSVIDTATNKVTSTVNVGNYPTGVTVTPDGERVYVANGGSDTVSVINTVTNTVIATVPVESCPTGIAVNSEGTKVYVVNGGLGRIDTGRNVSGGNNSISVIDTDTNHVIATVPVGNTPYGIAINPSGTKVYVANRRSNTTSVIDTATNKVTATVNVGKYPCGVAVNPAGTKAYVTNGGNNTVSVIDTFTNEVISNITVGNCPTGVAVTPDGTKVYVTKWCDGTISTIDTASNTIISTTSVGTGPEAFGQFIGSPPKVIINDTPTLKETTTEVPPYSKNRQLPQVMGVLLVLVGLLFTALTTIKKDVSLEIGISEKTLKYVGGVGVVFVFLGAYIILKCNDLI